MRPPASAPTPAPLNVATIEVKVNPTTTTAVGGSITASGDVLIQSSVKGRALADYKGIQLSVLAAAGLETVNASDQSNTTTSVTGTVRSSAGNVKVNAFHNFDGVSFITANDVEALTSVVVVGGLLSVGSSDLHATASATTQANVESSATLGAPTGAVEVHALSGNYTFASMKNVSGGLINLGSVNSNPTAESSGTTKAKLVGNVQGLTNGTSGASSIDVLAQAQDLATAKMSNAGGGALSISNSNSTSQGTPDVETTIGSSGPVIIASNNIHVQAVSFVDSDAGTNSDTGGALNVNLFKATASMTPTVKAPAARAARTAPST